MGEEEKSRGEAPRKYWNQKTGEILVMTPAEKEERDERLRLEAEKNAREEAERIAREEAAEKLLRKLRKQSASLKRLALNVGAKTRGRRIIIV